MGLNIGNIAGEWLAAFSEVMHNLTKDTVQLIDNWIPGDISSVINSKIVDKAYPTYTVNVGADLDQPITDASVYSEPAGVNRNLQDIVEVIDSKPMANTPQDVTLIPDSGSANLQPPVYSNNYYYDSHDYFDYRTYDFSKDYVNNGLITIGSNPLILPQVAFDDSKIRLASKNFYSQPDDVVASIYADLDLNNNFKSRRRRRNNYD